MPQDGRINLEMEGQPIDVRVATIPTVSGESISLRLLARNRFDFSLLGLTPAAESKIRDLIAQPNGIILLTGPTGCGKSTSLYTFLSMLNTMERRIVTVEDPVEHKLSGVMQIAVKPEINLTFATALRSILRGDPNVIMIGEMRDFETAEIAIRAALTGHLVFSTLHTNDAIGGITRLIDMGVQPFLVSSSVRAFLAQRLVRVLCPNCKQPAHHSQGVPGAGRISHGPCRRASCRRRAASECRHTGYQGRAALFEICLVTPAMQEHDFAGQIGRGVARQGAAGRDGPAAAGRLEPRHRRRDHGRGSRARDLGGRTRRRIIETRHEDARNPRHRSDQPSDGRNLLRVWPMVSSANSRRPCRTFRRP